MVILFCFLCIMPLICYPMIQEQENQKNKKPLKECKKPRIKVIFAYTYEPENNIQQSKLIIPDGSDFHAAIKMIKEKPQKPWEMLNKNPLLAIAVTKTFQESPFTTLIKTCLYDEPDKHLHYYLTLAQKIMCLNITFNKHNKAWGLRAKELSHLVGTVFKNKNHDQLAYCFYTLIEKVGAPRMNLKDFFDLFYDSPSKVYTFLKKYPLWTEKIDQSKNTVLMTAVKNFTDEKIRIKLLKFIIPFCRGDFFKEDKAFNTVFDEMYMNGNIQNTMILLDLIRETLSKIIPPDKLVKQFFDGLDQSKYAYVEKLITKNPELCFAKNPDPQSKKKICIAHYLRKIKIPKDTNENDQKELQKQFKSLQKKASNFVPLSKKRPEFFTKKDPTYDMSKRRGSIIDIISSHIKQWEPHKKESHNDNATTIINSNFSFGTKKD